MDETARLVAIRWMNATTTGDVDTAIELSSQSIVYTAGQVMRYEGHEGVRDIVEDYERLAGFVTVDVLDSVADAGVVALKRVEKYTIPSGAITIPSCSFVEVDGGVVTRWADYKDLQVLHEVAGL